MSPYNGFGIIVHRCQVAMQGHNLAVGTEGVEYRWSPLNAVTLLLDKRAKKLNIDMKPSTP